MLYWTVSSSCLPAAVGQLAAHSAYVQGAEKVAIIDTVGYRLDYVKKWIPGVHTIDFSKLQVRRALTLHLLTFPCFSVCGSSFKCWHTWTLGYLGHDECPAQDICPVRGIWHPKAPNAVWA